MSTPGSVSNHLEAVILIVLTYFNLPLLVTSTKYITHCNRYSHGKPSILYNQQLERTDNSLKWGSHTSFSQILTSLYHILKLLFLVDQVKTLISAYFTSWLACPSPVWFNRCLTCSRVLFSKPAPHRVWLGRRLRPWRHHWWWALPTLFLSLLVIGGHFRIWRQRALLHTAQTHDHDHDQLLPRPIITTTNTTWGQFCTLAISN